MGLFRVITTVLILNILSIGESNNGKRSIYTFVTYIQHIKTDQTIGLSNTQRMLKQKENLIIFGPAGLQFQIMERRKQLNTVFIAKQFKELETSWYSPHIDSKANSTFKSEILLNMSKIFMMAEAAEKDKLDSDYFIWVDSDFLYRSPQNDSKIDHPSKLVRDFYQWTQPQWIFFTKFKEQQQYLNYSQGQEQFIKRRLMFHEIAVPTFMGGFTSIATDIKNAYQSLLRIIVQSSRIDTLQIPFCLMPLRFPSLVPNTVSISLPDINQKIHLYEAKNRQPDRKQRYFKGIMVSNSYITLISDNQTTNYIFKLERQANMPKQLNPLTPSQFFDLEKGRTIQAEQTKTQLVDFLIEKQFFKTKVIIIEGLAVLILVCAYVKLLIINIKIRKQINRSNQQIEACYIKVSRHPTEAITN